MVNLSPGDIRKEGTAYDLAIAAAVLCCLGEASEAGLEKSAFIGELGLDGCVKPVKGVLPRVFAAAGQGIRRMFVPSENTAEGTAVKDIEIIGVNSLSELAGILTGREGTTVTLDTDNGPVAFEVNAASSVQLCDDENLFD